jgi:chromosome partitioning protein
MAADMQAISILSRKGGVGKTTLAVHLAVAAGQQGASVALVDLDPQKSAGDWWRARSVNVPALVETTARDVPAVIDAAKSDGFDWCILDTPPHADLEPVAAARVANLVVIPTRPGILDLRAIGATVELVKALKVPAVIVLNHVPAARGFGEASIVSEARQGLEAYGLPVAPMAIAQRVALSHALIDGRAVTEFEPDGKAADELVRLWKWLKEQLQ